LYFYHHLVLTIIACFAGGSTSPEWWVNITGIYNLHLNRI
jgi:hypothetical protein